jgi:hypothetical protein
MLWKECKQVDERLRFVARLLEGEKMARLGREFDISRKTGYKIFNRYRDRTTDTRTFSAADAPCGFIFQRLTAASVANFAPLCTTVRDSFAQNSRDGG